MLFVWVNFFGSVGFIFNYNFSGFGVYFWVICVGRLFICFVWCLCVVIEVFISWRFRSCLWSFVGVMYNYRKGFVMLYVNEKLVVMKLIGWICLLINYLVRMGVCIGDSRCFCGWILCM